MSQVIESPTTTAQRPRRPRATPTTSDGMQGTINLTIGWLLETLPPLPARDDTQEARIEAELERIRLVEATVKRWWRLI